MTKNKRTLNTLCAVCALLLSMYIPPAYASTRSVDDTSTAYIDTSESYDDGPDYELIGLGLTGEVTSYTDSSTSYVTGYMITKGIIYTHTRSYISARSKKTETMDPWANKNGDTGRFWSSIQAFSGAHSGSCSVNQKG